MRRIMTYAWSPLAAALLLAAAVNVNVTGAIANNNNRNQNGGAAAAERREIALKKCRDGYSAARKNADTIQDREVRAQALARAEASYKRCVADANSIR